MRNLTEEEIAQALDDNGESGDGCVAIEASLGELALRKTGTICGTIGNHAFVNVARLLGKEKLVRGWYDDQENALYGMVHIQCEDEGTAENIDIAAEKGDGSLRPNGPSLWAGFWEFEVE